MHCQRITLAVPQMACQLQRSAVEPHRESNRPGVVFWLLQKLGPGTWVQFVFSISWDDRRRHVLVFHLLAVAVFWNMYSDYVYMSGVYVIISCL